MSDSNTGNMDRRTLVKGLAAGVAAMAAVAPAAEKDKAKPAARGSDSRRSYAIVGCGSRARMFQDAIWGPHQNKARLVAVSDTNAGRMNYALQRAAEAGAAPPKTYAAADFDRMLREQKPDALIVCTPDATHDDYIVRGLDAGLDVITEKPMTTDAAKALRIADAVKRSGKSLRVTFNYRYSPFRSQLKELLMAGTIGEVLSVDFHWLLNTVHGADYFRRWHSNKAISGGLMVHKATHHFDLMNWWLSANPVSVRASGKREFYTPAMARRMGLPGPQVRCRTCPVKSQCSFYIDVAADAALKALYIDNEQYDGYFRDQCIWRENINIEDTMNVIVGYDTGATMSYSLNAFNSWEGYIVAFNGSKGRLEQKVVEQAFVAGASAAQSTTSGDAITTTFTPLRGAVQNIPPRSAEGNHGGGDAVLLADLFDPSTQPDPLMRRADFRAGAASILVGAAANIAFRTGQTVLIDDIAPGIPKPDLTSMPTRTQPVPMPISTTQL
jgi:predicted dehydrogenase